MTTAMARLELDNEKELEKLMVEDQDIGGRWNKYFMTKSAFNSTDDVALRVSNRMERYLTRVSLYPHTAIRWHTFD